MALSKRAREILNREDLIEKRDRWFSRLQNLFDSQHDDWNDQYAFALSGISGRSEYDPLTEPERWMEDCLENLALRSEEAGDEACFRPLSVDYRIYENNYTDKIFGSDVFNTDGQWYSKHRTTPIGTLEKPDIDRSDVWDKTRRAIETFLEADVALPIFGLPIIGSPLNIAVNLYGEKMLMEMVLEPENASKDLQTITDTLCDIHRHFRSLLPMKQLQPILPEGRAQPPGYGQLCGCSTHLISGSCYEELLAPLDDQLLSVYPNGGMIHLCGRHTQHIEAFRSMKSLKAIQVNDRAADDLEIYYNQLRSDQMIYLMPSDFMTAELAMSITNGDRLVLVSKPDRPIPRVRK